MPTFSTTQPNNAVPGRWVKLADVLARLAPPADEDKAWKRLSHRLQTGTVASRATLIEEEIFDYGLEVTRDQRVSRFIWAGMPHQALLDAATGVVELRGAHPEDGRPWRYKLHNIEFAEEDIADLRVSGTSDSPGLRSGRPPSHSWPGFAEELAFQAGDGGLSDPKLTVAGAIRKVFEAMEAMGYPTPSENTARPVVAKVLRRLAQ